MVEMAFHRYQLRAKAALGSKSTGTVREGALLRICFPNGNIGYADCHPWPELGDLPLEQQLALLAQGQSTPLLKKSLRFAEWDARARAQGVNLFEALPIPSSHLLITDLLSADERQLERCASEGFSCIKAKMGRRLEQEVPVLLRLLQAENGMKFVIDFNGSLTISQCRLFLDRVQHWSHLIDFIEDPFPFEYDSWKQIQKDYGCALACDRQSERAIGIPESAKVLVVKPAIQDEDLFTGTQQRVVATTYLDHPLGQLGAVYVAARSGFYETGGFLTHSCYEPNSFSHLLDIQNSKLVPPPGTGFGFDSLLTHLAWSSL